MNRFVFVCLLVMAWGYWELSGGADFTPEERPVVAVDPPAPAAEAPEAPPPEVVEPEPAPLTVPDPAPEEEIEDLAAPSEAAEEPPEQEEFRSLIQDAVAESLPAEEEAVDLTPDLPAALPAVDLRTVTGSVVNLREGPGTGFAVVDQLTQGTVTEVIESGEGGWIHIQVQGSDVSGWMSGDFLAPLNG